MGSLQELRSEVEEIKTTLREIAGHLKYTNMPSLPDPLKHAYIMLVEGDVDEQIASDLVQSAYVRLGENALDTDNSVERYMLETIAGMFRVVDAESAARHGRRVVALVGPTGVGKTTTIAKLAAQRKLTDGLAVALVSADTYRIGAIEQLQTFAAIADIPMEVVYAPSEIEGALKKFKDKDIIYIDTVGRSHYKNKEIEEVAGFVNCADPDEVHLVFSASTQTRTLLEIVERFSVLKPNRFVVTKTDEAASFGSLLGLVKQYPVPLSFVTTGQAVPDDIVVASPTDLAMMVYRGVIPHA
jgi:flagellar biosynthesis protein FlhF